MNRQDGKKSSQFIGITTINDTDFVTLFAAGINYKMTVANFRTALVRATTSVKQYAAISSAYAITTADFLVECTSGTFAVLLPSPSGIIGQQFQVKNSGAGTITLTPSGGETIDGSATKTLAQYDAILVMSNGTNWIIV